jgi:hypothetical protein
MKSAYFWLSVWSLGFTSELYAQSASEPGLEGRSDVILISTFDDTSWWKAWGLTAAPGNTALIEGTSAFTGKGRSLRVTIPKGKNSGTSFKYYFKKQIGSEPEEIYLRYYVKFDPDWKNATFSGKVPGFGGTYNRAGWGGRPSNGTDGWSARGTFQRPGDSTTIIGYYAYHADMQGTYGTVHNFTPDLRYGTWYAVEMYCKLNSPKQNNGILRAWIDGKLGFEKTDFRFRDISDLKIETIWFDVYHGGSAVPDQDIHVYFDNLVIARKPIGLYGALTNQTPKVSAGANQKITLPSSVSLDGTVSDDGLPASPGKVTTQWSKVRGPGTVTFANASAVDTTAGFSQAGVYELQLTADDGAASATDRVVVIAYPNDGSQKLPISAVTASENDGNVPENTIDGNLSTRWSAQGDGQWIQFDLGTKAIVSHLRIAWFRGDARAAKFDVAVSSDGTVWNPIFSGSGSGLTIEREPYVVPPTQARYVRIMGHGNTENDWNSTTEVEIWGKPGSANQAPKVNAGADQTITLPSNAILSGTAADDGLPNPPAKVTTSWSKVSGPGTVTFANGSAVDTTATFSVDGTYVLRLTASDSVLSSTDDVTITVKPKPEPPRVLASENFETGNLSGGTGWSGFWTTSGRASVTRYRSPRRVYQLQLLAASSAERSLNLSGVTQAKLKFWYKGYSMGQGEFAVLEVNDGSGWKEKFRLGDPHDDDAYHQTEIDLSMHQMVSGFKIRFRSQMSSIADYFFADDIEVSGVGGVTAAPQSSSASQDTEPPIAPQNFSAQASSTGVSLSWSPSTDNVGVTGYGILRDGKPIGQVSAPGTTFVDRNVTGGAKYVYSVVATDAAGNTSPLSNAVGVVIP